MGVPGCFNHLGCLEVTLILRDFKTVTGKIVKGFDDDHRWGDKDDDHKKHDDCDKCDEKKDGHKSYKPKVDVHVDVDDKCDFILLELTRDAKSVSLLKVEFEEEEYEEDEVEIKVANVKFKEKTCIAVNVCDIIYAGVNAEIDEEEIEIELCECPDGPSNGVSNKTTPEPKV